MTNEIPYLHERLLNFFNNYKAILLILILPLIVVAMLVFVSPFLYFPPPSLENTTLLKEEPLL